MTGLAWTFLVAWVVTMGLLVLALLDNADLHERRNR